FVKTEVGTQADLGHSENRDISAILFKTELTVNRRRKVHKYGNERARGWKSEKVLSSSSKIFLKILIKYSGNEDETLHISTNDDVTNFGYKSETLVNTIGKCPLEVKDIKYKKKKNNFAHIKAYCCGNSKKDKVCLEYNIFVVKKPNLGQPLQCYFTIRGVLNHTFFKTSQARRCKRTLFREEMGKIPSKQARIIGEIKSEGVYKKIRSEMQKTGRRMTTLAEPCKLGLFSRNQVQVASIAKKVIKGGSKYYALVITNHRGKTYPVAERIANMHDAGSIGNWLMKFQQLHFTTVLCAKASSNLLKISLLHLDEMCEESTAIEMFRKKRKAITTFSTPQNSPKVFDRDGRALVDAQVNNSLSADFNVSDPLYPPDFAEYFLKHYASYLPMWSSIISDGQSNSFIPTNGVVERWFHQVKHNIISKLEYGVGRIEFGRFVDAVRLNITSETRQGFFNINISKRGIADKSVDRDIDLRMRGDMEQKELLSPRTSNFLNLRRNSFTSPLATS
uniref:Uncharacterized protein n=1 Tax=Glossina palpalis gambiensis TaxID=67801 RepID=A0A1B0BCI9_9MUSC